MLNTTLSLEEIADLPIDSISPHRVNIVKVEGERVFREPQFSENGNGWWAGNTRVFFLFKTEKEALAERAGI